MCGMAHVPSQHDTHCLKGLKAGTPYQAAALQLLLCYGDSLTNKGKTHFAARPCIKHAPTALHVATATAS